MKRGNRRFRPGRRLTLFVGVLLPLLCGLGLWQLERAKEKQAISAEYLQRAGMLAVPIEGLDLDAKRGLAFTRLRLVGRFEAEQYYLIDNQVRAGQVGYWIIHWFVTNDGRAWLLNRGFLPGSAQREQWPVVSTPSGQLEVTATVWPDMGLVPLLAAEPAVAAWPRRRQRVDVVNMATDRERGQAVDLRLEAGQPGVFTAAPLHFAAGADRNRGYAVQWFGLAGVLLFGYLGFGYRRPDGASAAA